MKKMSLDDLVAAMACHAAGMADLDLSETGRQRRMNGDIAHRFVCFSLGDWLAACRAAGIDHVPATEVARVAISDIMNDADDASGRRVEPALNEVYKSGAPNTMLRWDCCAPLDIKHALGEGRPEWHQDFQTINIGDPRAFDILYEYPRATVPIWRRPWVKAKIVEKYPVEFRVYVLNGKVHGCSNYYPQRDLPEAFRPLAERAISLTERLVAAIPTPVWMPPRVAEGIGTDAVHATADWLVTEAGEILFLEGGPPFTPNWGGHPCCFRGGKIEGIALAAAEGEYE